MTDSSKNDKSVVVPDRKRKRRGARESMTLSLNMVPMIDIVFLLLIFFIVTTTFKRAEGVLPSRLPSQGSLSTQVALPITPIVIHLTQTGEGPADYVIRVEHFVEAPPTFGELASFLKNVQSQPGFDNETPVVIHAGADVVWDHVVGCWNAAVQAGCKQIAFGVE